MKVWKIRLANRPCRNHIIITSATAPLRVTARMFSNLRINAIAKTHQHIIMFSLNTNSIIG